VPPDAREVLLAERRPQPGESLHLVSHPRQLEVLWVYAAAWLRQRGVVALEETGDGAAPQVLIVQAPLGEGEEGGPVVDAEGRLVGIASGRGRPQQQVAFAIDVVEVRAFLDEQRPLTSPRTAAEYARRGERFLLLHEHSLALKEYDAALTLDRGHVDSWVGRAQAQLRLGDHERALGTVNVALRLAPRHGPALCRRAAIWLANGKPDRAILDADAALKVDSRLALAHVMRAQARLALDQPEKARTDADEAVWLEARLALAYRVRGVIHTRLREWERAVADLSHALALDPLDIGTYLDRAALHHQKQDLDASLADLTQALKLLPEGARRKRLAEQVRAATSEKNDGKRAILLGNLIRAMRSSR
jgi:tetratricopeptide (TPR) repeat protein